jgi:hypothetical protein
MQPLDIMNPRSPLLNTDFCFSAPKFSPVSTYPILPFKKCNLPEIGIVLIMFEKVIGDR